MNKQHKYYKIIKGSLFFLTIALIMILISISWKILYKREKVDYNTTSDSQKNYDKIQRVYQLITSNYVETVSQEQLTEGAIRGMLLELGDPYSTYLTKEEAEQLSELLNSSFQGIGTEISDVDGKIIIIAPLKNSPAERSGLRSQDEIIAVDQKSVAGKSINDVIKLIKGTKGTTVEITVNRKNIGKPLTFIVKRDEIPLETVFTTIEESNNKKIGVIEITQFSESTANDFKLKLKELEAEEIDGIVIDVRGNPGGLLSSVEEVLNSLLPKQSLYIKVQDRKENIESFYTKKGNTKDYPIAVLIDEGSASAAEILAAALNETKNYPLVGSTTFGKGTIQQAVSLGDGSEVKMTFFKWLTPNGAWIHKRGIKPTLTVKQPDFFSSTKLNSENDLKLNDNNDTIKVLQDNITSLGYIAGRNDGYFDEQTEKAVKAFQHEKSIPVTGIVDKKTENLLNETIVNMIKEEKNDLQKIAALNIISK